MRELIDPHASGNRDRRYLRDLDRPLADDVAAKNFIGHAIDDQLAEPGCSPVDDRPRGRIKVNDRSRDIMFFPCLRFGHAYLCILRVGKATDRIHFLIKRHRRTSYGVGGRDEAVLYRWRNQHQAPGDIPSSKDMWRRGPQVRVNLHKTSMIGFDARGWEI